MNLTGKIGDLMDIGFNYNTEATFDFENQFSFSFHYFFSHSTSVAPAIVFKLCEEDSTDDLFLCILIMDAQCLS